MGVTLPILHGTRCSPLSRLRCCPVSLPGLPPSPAKQSYTVVVLPRAIPSLTLPYISMNRSAAPL